LIFVELIIYSASTFLFSRWSVIFKFCATNHAIIIAVDMRKNGLMITIIPISLIK
jgi:hypothetical protein